MNARAASGLLLLLLLVAGCSAPIERQANAGCWVLEIAARYAGAPDEGALRGAFSNAAYAWTPEGAGARVEGRDGVGLHLSVAGADVQLTAADTSVAAHKLRAAARQASAIVNLSGDAVTLAAWTDGHVWRDPCSLS